jgi:hypothetical protein
MDNDEKMLDDWIATGRPIVPAGVAVRTVRGLQSEQRHKVVKRWPIAVAGLAAAAAAILLWQFSTQERQNVSTAKVAMRPQQSTAAGDVVGGMSGTSPMVDAAAAPSVDAAVRRVEQVTLNTAERTADSVLSTISAHLSDFRRCRPSKGDKWTQQRGRLVFSVLEMAQPRTCQRRDFAMSKSV